MHGMKELCMKKSSGEMEKKSQVNIQSVSLWFWKQFFRLKAWEISET